MINQVINFFELFWVDWFDCIRNPLTICRKTLNSAISDNEKLLFAFRIWIMAFLLSLSFEVPLFYYIGIKIETPFFLSYFAYGVIYLFILSFFIHLSLRIFRINSVFYETFILYAIIIGSYSPFISLLSYPSLFNNVLLIKALKEGVIPPLKNIPLLFYIKYNYDPSIVILSSFITLLNLILFSVVTILLLYAVIERYGSDKFRTMFSITFFQLLILPQLFSLLIKDVILLLYKG